jgi:F-type H+-transporting ATPase subunit c
MEDGIYIVKAAASIGAALVMGIGCIAPAYGQGLIGAEACKNIGKYPESYNNISKTMLLALAIVESSALYALLIALLLIFFNR